jgi:hypothetical protein
MVPIRSYFLTLSAKQAVATAAFHKLSLYFSLVLFHTCNRICVANQIKLRETVVGQDIPFTHLIDCKTVTENGS